MNTVDVEGKQLALTKSGFLAHGEEWTHEVAGALAIKEGIALEEKHWELIDFIRDYYQMYNHLPNARLFVHAVRKVLGEEKGNSRYLHGLFPDGPVRQVCKIAGLGKPPGCL